MKRTLTFAIIFFSSFSLLSQSPVRCTKLFDAGLYVKCIKCLTEYITTDGDYDLEAVYDLAVAHFQIRDFEGALEIINIVIESQPRFGDSYDLRGGIYFEQGMYGSAQLDFTIALSLREDRDSFRGLVMTRYQLGVEDDLDICLRDSDRAIELYPEEADFYYYRGLFKIQFGKLYESGCADLKRAYNRRSIQPSLSKILKENCDIDTK